MRDPARIGRMIEKLRKLWEDCPDMRLGQLMVVLTSHCDDPIPDLFIVEDKEIENQMDVLVGIVEKRKNDQNNS